MSVNMHREFFIDLAVIAIGISALINSREVGGVLKAYTEWWEKKLPGRVIQLNLDAWVWIARIVGLAFILGSALGLIKKIHG